MDAVARARRVSERTLGGSPPSDVLRTRFAAPLEPVDCKQAAEPARARINTWVATQTRDKIKDLRPAGSVDAATRTVGPGC